MPNGSGNGAQMRAILTSRVPAWMFPLPLVWPPINECRQPALEINMEQVSRVSGLRSLVPILSHVNVCVFNNVKTYVTVCHIHFTMENADSLAPSGLHRMPIVEASQLMIWAGGTGRIGIL